MTREKELKELKYREERLECLNTDAVGFLRHGTSALPVVKDLTSLMS